MKIPAKMSFRRTNGRFSRLGLALMAGSLFCSLQSAPLKASLDAGPAAIDLIVGFDIERMVSGGLQPYRLTEGDAEVVEAELDLYRLTLTGIEPGTATIAVMDALNSRDPIEVTVHAGAGVPPVEDLRAVGGGDTDGVALALGASPDEGASYARDYAAGEAVTVLGAVSPDAVDIGMGGSIFAVVKVLGPGGGISWFYRDQDGAFRLWDKTLASLQPAREVASLDSTEYVEVFEGEIAAGSYRVFIGYQADGGTLVYHGSPLALEVE